MAGHVTKVNKNRKQVQIVLGDEGTLLHSIWCSIEYVEANADTEQSGIDGAADRGFRV